MKDELDKIIDIIKNENPEIIREFFGWFNNYLSSLAGQREQDELSFKLEDIMEVKAMFATRTREFLDTIKQESFEQGERKVISNLAEHGYSAEQIAEISGLSIDGIHSLLDN